MLGDFTFHNPTKLYFGENSLENLSKELGKYGEKVMLVYGGGSIRKNGIYDAVRAELRKAGKQTVELSGVMPNPTIEKVMEGVGRLECYHSARCYHRRQCRHCGRRSCHQGRSAKHGSGRCPCTVHQEY